MRNVFIYISFFGLLMVNRAGQAQVTTDFLFAKMDGSPQHFMWDGAQPLLMGYTKLLGAGIDLPSPTLIFNEGDSVELTLQTFSQAAPHTIHLHGLDVDQANDGVPHLSYLVEHDSTGVYSFVAPHAGTYLYHCHVVSTLHVQAGMYGLIIIRPPDGSNATWDGGYPFDIEHSWLFSEVDLTWHTNAVINDPYDPMDTTHLMLDYNPGYFLINGKSETQLGAGAETHLTGSANDFIYLRLANVGFYGNRVVFPSELNAQIVASDGRPLPNVVNSDTVELLPGERYGVLLNPTDEYTGTVDVEYFDLNTQQVVDTQTPPVTIEGFNQTLEFLFENFDLYPNPTSQELNVLLPSKGNGQIEIYDPSGRRIDTKFKEKIPGLITVSTADLSNGIYLITYTEKEKSVTKKFIVKH